MSTTSTAEVKEEDGFMMVDDPKVKAEDDDNKKKAEDERVQKEVLMLKSEINRLKSENESLQAVLNETTAKLCRLVKLGRYYDNYWAGYPKYYNNLELKTRLLTPKEEQDNKDFWYHYLNKFHK